MKQSLLGLDIPEWMSEVAFLLETKQRVAAAAAAWLLTRSKRRRSLLLLLCEVRPMLEQLVPTVHERHQRVAAAAAVLTRSKGRRSLLLLLLLLLLVGTD